MKMLSKILLATMLATSGSVEDSTSNKVRNEYIERITTPQIYSIMTENEDTLNYKPFQVSLNFNPKPENYDFLSEVYKDYYDHKELIDNWIGIMKFPDGKRAIIDKWTIEIVDTIPDTRNARRNYRFKGDRRAHPDLKSASGRLEKTKDAFKRFDKYRNIFSGAIVSRELSWELQYIPITESHVLPVRSAVGAQGYWQIMKGTKGDLVINRQIDERNSVVRSTERAADKLRGLHALFQDYRLDATCYIRGEYGVTYELEDMLNLKKEGKLFNSYKGIVYLHSGNDHTILEKEDFWKKTRRMLNTRSGIFSDGAWKKAYPYRKSDTPPQGLYESYLEDVKGNDSIYVKSFWEYYDLKIDSREVYWQYHEYLKKSKNNFDTPHYVPRLIAAIIVHNDPNFEYDRQRPLDIVEFNPTKSEVKEYYKDEEFRALNKHIPDRNLKDGKFPKDTRFYKVDE